MARFQNIKTHVIVSVADEKAHRFDSPDWSPLGAPAASASGYGGQKVAELRAEIDRRNEDRDEDAKLSTEGNKAALIATLEADDA